MCKNPTLFWSQCVTPLRPPTASQWAAVRITTEACRRSNPHEVIPAAVQSCQSFSLRFLLATATELFEEFATL